MESITSNLLAARNAILQQNKTLQNVADKPAGDPGAIPSSPTIGGGDDKAPFATTMREAIGQVNQAQTAASEAAAAYEAGETSDIAAVMLAKQKASVGFEATLQVRNKLLSAYENIMNMPV